MATRSIKFFIILYAGIIASIFSTIAQILLWWIFWDVLPDIFYRDMRFTAAIILGQGVLPPPAAFDLTIFIVASFIHLSLSIAYAFVLSSLIKRVDLKASVILGGLFGLMIFTVNMYGVVMIYPWFEETRDWITVVAHVVFGVSAAITFKTLPFIKTKR